MHQDPPSPSSTRPNWNPLSPKWLRTALIFALVSIVLLAHRLGPESLTALSSLRYLRSGNEHRTEIKNEIKNGSTAVRKQDQHPAPVSMTSVNIASTTSPITEEHPSPTSIPKSNNGSATSHEHDQHAPPPSIPNIVHFVHFLFEHEHLLNLYFREFLSIYSAHYHLKPDVLYIHTNIPPSELEERVNGSESAWTHAVARIPNLKFVYREPLTQTKKGYSLNEIAHKTDFARVAILAEYGGIYLDDDGYVLRPLEPLLTAGFENVLGFQPNNDICPSVILASPNNTLMRYWSVLMDHEFDGSWAAHSVDTLTRLADDFVATPRQVLLLPQNSFFPFSWDYYDCEIIYKIHRASEPADPIVHNADPFADEALFLDTWARPFPGTDKTWEVDWRQSYTLHGWNHGASDNDDFFGEFGGISLAYVMALNSNFARAVYPAVEHAVKSGFLDGMGIDGIEEFGGRP
ncbi:hypothetical protein MMC21_008232 [Puttea exsequens]|nr:hypothetical protein [Puttea exsequens]